MQTKVVLNIPQLTLAKIVQLGRHETVNTRSEHYSPSVAGSIPVRGIEVSGKKLATENEIFLQ